MIKIKALAKIKVGEKPRDFERISFDAVCAELVLGLQDGGQMQIVFENPDHISTENESIFFLNNVVEPTDGMGWFFEAETPLGAATNSRLFVIYAGDYVAKVSAPSFRMARTLVDVMER